MHGMQLNKIQNSSTLKRRPTISPEASDSLYESHDLSANIRPANPISRVQPGPFYLGPAQITKGEKAALSFRELAQLQSFRREV